MPPGMIFCKREANAIFVAVDGGAIEVPVADGGGALDGRGDFVRRDVVGAEGAEADGGHAGAGVESSLGDERGIDRSCIHENGTNVYVSWKNGEMLRLYRLLWMSGKLKHAPPRREGGTQVRGQTGLTANFRADCAGNSCQSRLSPGG